MSDGPNTVCCECRRRKALCLCPPNGPAHGLGQEEIATPILRQIDTKHSEFWGLLPPTACVDIHAIVAREIGESIVSAVLPPRWDPKAACPVIFMPGDPSTHVQQMWAHCQRQLTFAGSHTDATHRQMFYRGAFEIGVGAPNKQAALSASSSRRGPLYQHKHRPFLGEQ
jgi:hypothetical protein